MELHLTPQQEAQLHQLASHTGKEAEQVAQEFLTLALEHRARTTERITQGVASVKRGDFIEHDDIAALIERDFRF